MLTSKGICMSACSYNLIDFYSTVDVMPSPRQPCQEQCLKLSRPISNFKHIY